VLRNEHLREYHDEYGIQEWDRVEKSLTTRIEYEIHRAFLGKQVRSGDSVLDLGSGPGRHAIDMMQAGARVTLGDISDVQLGLAKQKIAEAGLEAEAFHQLDICDLSQFTDNEFDLVVCIGGAISYVQDGYASALSEMVRVLKPGGRLVVGAMSLYGLLSVFPAGDKAGQLRTFDQHIDRTKLAENSGFLITELDSPVIHMPLFLTTSSYLKDFVTNLGCNVVSSASANPMTADGMKLERVADDELATRNLIELEILVSERPEVADSGEWVIVAAEKRGA
jgi:ubiquinone/menaquinone biosynthesis C-methylase UbiE